MFNGYCAAARALMLLLVTAGSAADVPELKDPTRPLRPAVANEASSRDAELPTLDSVLIGGGRRFAVIDGHRMAEGDKRLGMKVLKIRPDGVVVSMDGSGQTTLKITNSRMHKELR